MTDDAMMELPADLAALPVWRELLDSARNSGCVCTPTLYLRSGDMERSEVQATMAHKSHCPIGRG